MTQINLVTAQTSQPLPEPPNPSPSTSTAPDISGLSAMGFVAVVYTAAVWAAVREMMKDWKDLPKPKPLVENNIPCRKCQFFSNNHYLKCAVNPSIAMTKDAIECRDYCPSEKALTTIERLWISRGFRP